MFTMATEGCRSPQRHAPLSGEHESSASSSASAGGTSVRAEYAEPAATKSWELCGVIIALPVKPSVRINRSRSWSRKCSGPPKNATLPRMGLPHASPEIVWLTTA